MTTFSYAALHHDIMHQHTKYVDTHMILGGRDVSTDKVPFQEEEKAKAEGKFGIIQMSLFSEGET